MRGGKEEEGLQQGWLEPSRAELLACCCPQTEYRPLPSRPQTASRPEASLLPSLPQSSGPTPPLLNFTQSLVAPYPALHQVQWVGSLGGPAPAYLVMRRGSMKLGESRRRLRMGE